MWRCLFLAGCLTISCTEAAQEPSPAVLLERTNDSPPFTLIAVAEALERYSIAIPETIAPLKIRADLEDRGRTIWHPNGEKLQVWLGPKAFTSWALLGSTLAHELEVHAQQNIKMIAALNAIGFPASAWAERKAYRYELANAERFGLSADEVQRIRATMEYYYAE